MRREKGDGIKKASILGASSRRHHWMPKGTECVAEEPLLLVLFSADPFAVGNLTSLQRHTECWVRHYFDNKREQKIKKKKSTLNSRRVCPSPASGFSGQT